MSVINEKLRHDYPMMSCHIPMRIKIMTITLLLKILEIKKEFLEIGPFRKRAKTLFSIKDINWNFYTNFLDINA